MAAHESFQISRKCSSWFTLLPSQTNQELLQQMVSKSKRFSNDRLKEESNSFYNSRKTFFRFTPPYLFDGEFYPNYLGGSGYVFTMDTAKKLYDASMNVPLIHLEDVYLTGK